LSIEFDTKIVKVWEQKESFLKLNFANETPVLVNNSNKYVIYDSYLITEYLEKFNETSNFLFYGSNEFEIKKIIMWFDKKFYNEVSKIILDYKLYSIYTNKRITNVLFLDTLGKLRFHLGYIEMLLKDSTFILSDIFTMADVTVAAHLSVIDYLGEIDWNKHKRIKEWYCLMKAKKSFNTFFTDKIGNMSPPPHYYKVDF
jgi:glutathione S-transferase